MKQVYHMKDNFFYTGRGLSKGLTLMHTVQNNRFIASSKIPVIS